MIGRFLHARMRAAAARERLRAITELALDGLRGHPGARLLARHDVGVRCARKAWHDCEREVVRLSMNATHEGLADQFTARGWEARPYGEGWQAVYRSSVSSRSVAMITWAISHQSARLTVTGGVTVSPPGPIIEASDEEWSNGWSPVPESLWVEMSVGADALGTIMDDDGWRVLRRRAVAVAEATAWRLVAPAPLRLSLSSDIQSNVDWFDDNIIEETMGYAGSIEAFGQTLTIPALAPLRRGEIA